MIPVPGLHETGTNPGAFCALAGQAGGQFFDKADEPVQLPADVLDSFLEAIESATAPAPPQHYRPPVPESLAAAGVTPSQIEQIILKMLYFRGELVGRDLALALGLRFSVFEEVVERL